MTKRLLPKNLILGLSTARSEQTAIAKRMNEYVRRNDPRHENALALVRERNASETDKASVDFYEGRITRGAYNNRCREIAQQRIEQVRVASAN